MGYWKDGKRHGYGIRYYASGRKTRTGCPKLVPGAGILPAKFQLEGPSRLMPNNGLLTRHF